MKPKPSLAASLMALLVLNGCAAGILIGGLAAGAGTIAYSKGEFEHQTGVGESRRGATE